MTSARRRFSRRRASCLLPPEQWEVEGEKALGSHNKLPQTCISASRNVMHWLGARKVLLQTRGARGLRGSKGLLPLLLLVLLLALLLARCRDQGALRLAPLLLLRLVPPPVFSFSPGPAADA